MAKSKFFRVFVEGNTISDGREITAEMIDQIVATFNRVAYQPRINCEHIKGFSPEPPFNCYGDVAAVEARDVELTIAGKTQKLRALYAQLEPNEQLVAITRKGQKQFTSVELTPSYAGSGKVGLVGLAVTDQPASLGTEALNFAPLKAQWDGRKASPGNFFTAADPAGVVFELEPEDKGSLISGITDAIAAGFAKFTAKPEEKKPEPKPEAAPAGFDVAAFSATLGEQVAGAIGKLSDAVDAKLAPLIAGQADFAALKTRLETEPAPGSFARQPTGGGAGQHLTDC